MKSKTKILVESAVLVAIATVLSIFPKFEGVWANGGSITVCSMLPIIIISYRHGIKWGVFSGFIFSLLQLVTGGFYSAAPTIGMVFLTLMLDYIIPYSVIGLGGIFKSTLKKPATAMVAGTILVMILRYISHLLSGNFLWKSIEYAQEEVATMGSLGDWALGNFSGDAIYNFYNIVYNGSYMIPELIITTVGAMIIGKVLAKQLKADN